MMNSELPRTDNSTPNMTTNQSNSVDDTVVQSGPGARLLAARESRNMAVSEVASLLCLDCSVVRAIEQDDMAKLPSATFVKGYIRGYAKLVGLDGQLLVDEYNQFAGPSKAGLKVTDMATERKSGAGRWLLALIILAAVLALTWFWSNPSDQPVSTDTMQSDESLATPTQSEFENGTETSSSDEREAVDDVIEKLLQGVNDEPVATQAPAADSEVEAADEAVVANGAETNAEVSSKPEAAAASQFLNLRLVGSQTSWVSIRDDRQKRIFRNNLNAGVSREVSGVPPMIVNLGNAEGVEFYVDGKLYDHSAWHKADGTARFVLNPAR